MTNEIKVLIIDDSKVIRNALKHILKHDRITSIDEAENGEEGYKKIVSFKPDIVLLDINMPVMDGLMLLRILRKNKIFVKIIVLSTLAKIGSRTTIDALNLGAIDFIQKPEGNIETISKEIIDKIIYIYDIKENRFLETPENMQIAENSVIKDFLESKKQTEKLEKPIPKLFTKEIKDIFSETKTRPTPKLVAIGISTGGPRALNIILPTLEKTFPIPIVIVQHMQETFITEFMKILQNVCKIKIDIAENEKEIERGTAYFAPGQKQTGVLLNSKNKMIFSVKEKETVSGHAPSVDYLYSSICESIGGAAIAVIMTGMGADGAKGIYKLHNQNAVTIAQDEQTCTVFGMPRNAIGLNAADIVLPLEEIFPFIETLLKKKFML